MVRELCKVEGWESASFLCREGAVTERTAMDEEGEGGSSAGELNGGLEWVG